MAQDLGLDIAAGPSVTGWTSLNTSTIANGGTDTSSSFDLGSPTPIQVGLKAELSLAASADDSIKIYVLWSYDNTDFDDVANADLVMAIDGVASSTVKKNRTFDAKARYGKLYIVNESQGSINSTGNTIAIYDVFGNQV